MPAPPSTSTPSALAVAPRAERQARPASATTAIATKISRCSTHQGQGCMSKTCCVDERDADGAKGQRGNGRLACDAVAERHASSAISSISTQAPNGICATPKALRAWAPISGPNTSASSYGAAVGDQVLLGECRRAVDQAHHLDDAPDATEIAVAGRSQRAEQVDGDGARRGLAIGRAHGQSELADPGLAVLLRDVAGKKDQLAAAHEGHVGCGRHRERRQADAQGLKAFGDGRHGQPGARIGRARRSYTVPMAGPYDAIADALGPARGGGSRWPAWPAQRCSCSTMAARRPRRLRSSTPCSRAWHWFRPASAIGTHIRRPQSCSATPNTALRCCARTAAAPGHGDRAAAKTRPNASATLRRGTGTTGRPAGRPGITD